MARYAVKGIDEYAKKLSRVMEKSPDTAKKAIYSAASVMADEIRRGIQALPEIPNNKMGSPKELLDGITKAQKQGLLDGFGFTPVMEDKKGFLNVQLGYEGYNSVRTKRYPNGQPNLLIARSVESGTTFRKKHPFVRPAVAKTKGAAEKELEKVIDQEIQKIMGGK